MTSMRRLPAPSTRMISVHRIKEMISKGEIQLDAPYQREIIWESKKMSELIDSIINNYYIPPLLFAVRRIRGKNVRIVIDGKQRLTSARRFLKNLLPYIDTSSGTAVNKYYIERLDRDADDEQEKALRDNQQTPEHFITTEEFNIFNNFEFVCVEYFDIDEDDEFEIFSRVQLGVAITSAEKLKATNSRVAEECRKLADNYQVISTVLQRKGPAELFKLIAHLMLTIKNGTETFASPKRLQDFVRSDEDPSRQLVRKTNKVLATIESIVNDRELKMVMIDPYMKMNSKNSVKALEFIVFGMFISLVERNRSPSEYSQDFQALKDYLMETREGKVYLGRENFLDAMSWVQETLDKENLISTHITITDDEDEDEDEEFDQLQEEDATIPNSATPIPARTSATPSPARTSATTSTTNNKRRRADKPVAVAKRGGKLPAGAQRRPPL
ncbi:hypothetical protein MBANPS3_000256 [Mucor bainieri]